MELSKKDVLYIAQLARLGVTDAEAEDLTKDMQNILKFVEKINKLDTKDIEPLYNVNDIVNVSRADTIKESLENAEIEKNAPQFKNGHIVVPPIID